MSDDHDLREHERAALDHVRRLRGPSSDAARARTRAAFVGDVGHEPPTESAPGQRTSAPQRRAGMWWRAAVAAACVALFVYGRMPARPWSVSGIDGPATVSLDREPRELSIGGTVDAGWLEIAAGAEIELEWGRLHLRLRSGSVLELPPPPGRWFGRARTLRLTSGEAYGSSGEGSPGFELRLETPEATARLLGTTFAVFRTGDATCFCLYRGGLEVTPRGGEPFVLPVGNRVFVYDDGRAPEIQPLDAGEQMKLRMIDDAAQQ